jgi:hypothetical protein
MLLPPPPPPLQIRSPTSPILTPTSQDRDGIIYPLDTFRGFRRIGFGYLLSLLAVFLIHGNFSYPTLPSFIPDPLFRIYISEIHKCKHGSDSGTFDPEGRFVPQHFEDIFSKYGGGKDGLTIWDMWDFHKGQSVLLDPIGWVGQIFECECCYPKRDKVMITLTMVFGKGLLLT